MEGARPNWTCGRVIRHIVFFTLAQGADRATVRAQLARLGGVPGVTTLEVGENLRSDRQSGEIDLVVYAEFADEAALAAYRLHPLYAEVTALVRPQRAIRLAADIRSE